MKIKVKAVVSGTSRPMKDSGIEWVGQIPSQWKVEKNKHLFTCDKYLVGKESTTMPLLSLTTKGIRQRSKDDRGGKVPESFDTYQYVRPNQLVMCLFDLDCSAVFSGLSSYDGMISPAYKVLSCKDTLIPPYAAYWFQFIFNGRKFMHYSKNLRYTLTYDEFAELPFLLPSVEVQKAIVKGLDAVCARIDSVVEKTCESIEEYKKLKQSLITEAVTKGIRPNRELKDSGIAWIGAIPEEWDVSRHKYVMHKEKQICEYYKGEDIISLTMNGVVIRNLDAGGKMPTTFDGYQYVEPNTLLLCLFDIDVTPRCVGIVKNNGLTSPAYSKFIIHEGYHIAYYDYLLRAIDDSKVFVHLSKNLRNSLTEADFGALPTIVPPFEEQEEISKYLDDTIEKIDDLISKKEVLISNLNAFKKSVIFEFVTGKKECPHEHY